MKRIFKGVLKRTAEKKIFSRSFLYMSYTFCTHLKKKCVRHIYNISYTFFLYMWYTFTICRTHFFIQYVVHIFFFVHIKKQNIQPFSFVHVVHSSYTLKKINVYDIYKRERLNIYTSYMYTCTYSAVMNIYTPHIYIYSAG